MEMFSMGERSKSQHRLGGAKVCEAEEVREYLINLRIENEILASVWTSTSKSISSKFIFKYHVSVLTRLSRVSQNPFQNNKSSESSITTIYQSKIS